MCRLPSGCVSPARRLVIAHSLLNSSSHRSHIFGLKADVVSNIHYLDETFVLYVAGHNLIIYDTQKKSQRFIHGR
jgi:hypothetical protein